MADTPLTDIKNPIKFIGGAITKGEKASIPFGGFSMIQNMRGVHGADGRKALKQRGGMARKHTSIISGTPKITSLYQFSKGARAERHFFAQAADDDVYEATDAPPTVTDATFGGKVFTGSGSSIPASWANLDDLMVFSNGVDQHKIYAGTTNYVKKFIKYDFTAAPPTIPEQGYDYTKQVTDGLTTTLAVLDSLDIYANHECIFICTPIPANKLTWTFVSGHENDTAAVGTLRYRKSDNTWTDTSETDETIATSGKTLGQDGSMTWDQPSDEIPCYMFGVSGFWYRWETDTQLDAEVEVSSLTYGTDGKANDHFMSLVNVWDGIPEYAIEAKFFDYTSSVYYERRLALGADPERLFEKKKAIYLESSGDLISIGGMVYHATAWNQDILYWNSPNVLIGVYIDVGATPNTNSTTEINDIDVWTGAGWTSVGTISDGTSGFGRSGWITWARQGSEEKTQFQQSLYQTYWYRLCVKTATVSAAVQISIDTMPYFDIAEAGIGMCNCAWKNRMVYTFDRYPNLLYISAKYRPMVLNGRDFAIMEAGDGRNNKIVCMKNFHNELMVWQEEKGKDGGTLTLFQGNSPSTYGPLLLSSHLGTLNAKSAVVVDGVKMPDGRMAMLAFWISHYGICVTDGMKCWIISDDIENYFDPLESTTCLRRGYDNDHWIEYDSSDHTIKVGLVTGTSATVPNIFLVLDLNDWSWDFDVRTPALSCMTEVEAASGDLAVLQYGGGVTDGFIYRLNTGTDDIHGATPTTALIDAYARMEFNKNGLILDMRELLLTMKVQDAGNCTVTPYTNNVAGSALTLPMTAETASEAMRRQRTGLHAQDEQLSLVFQNATASQELYLLEVGLEMTVLEDH